MPELPEVETVRRQLEPELQGRVIEALEVLDPKWTEPTPPETLVAALAGRRIEGLGRRGKYLLLCLDRDETLVMHLRMTGNLLLAPASDGAPDADAAPTARWPDEPTARPWAGDGRHLRARLRLAGGGELWFTDPRRFGRAFIASESELQTYLDARLGVEPLAPDFTPDLLAAVSAGRTAPLKSFLLDQSRLAGVGNIYADEALFRAELHPLSPAGSMRAEHHRALHAGVIAALRAGIEFGGASINDYRDSRGESGSMQDEFLVHRRGGEPCPTCETSIDRIVVSGRATYYCPACQIRLRRRKPRSAPG